MVARAKHYIKTQSTRYAPGEIVKGLPKKEEAELIASGALVALDVAPPEEKSAAGDANKPEA